MAGSFTVTISSLSALNIGGSKRSEASEIKDIIDRGLQILVSSHATSITLKHRDGTTAGTMSWTQVNNT